MIRLGNAAFERTAAKPSQFIRDGLPQVVFAGRSNVGKSSVINCLLGRKDLARVGASPGKTANINYFRIDGALYFADLPGYGYAKVSAAERERWAELMESYFNGEDLMTCGVLIVDIRHEPTRNDADMNRWFVGTGKRYVVAANKSDKLSRMAAAESLRRIRQVLELGEDVPVIAFSARTGEGKKELTASVLDLCGCR